MRTRPLRALIVEDNSDSRDMYTQYLTYSGWQVEEVTDGAEALAVAALFAPDVIVMDISMPVIDGLTCIRRLRQDPRTKDTAIVALTAFADKEGDARGAGCDEFLTKPCPPDRLEMILRRVVAAAGADRESGAHGR